MRQPSYKTPLFQMFSYLAGLPGTIFPYGSLFDFARVPLL